MCDNPILNVNGDGIERLKMALALASRKSAKGWCVRDNRLIFFWADNIEMTPFPAPANMDRCAEIAMDWLASATHPPEPNHDGDNKCGWRCFTESWGQIDGYGFQAFVAVEPYWLMFGK